MLRSETGILTGPGFLLGFLAAVFFSAPGLAQQTEAGPFPVRPITFIVPIPPGGSSDASCRLISKEAEKFLGQPIVVVNKPGGSFSIAIAAIAASKPDGYTIGYAGHPGLFVAPLVDKVPYHPVRDLRGIMQFGYLNISVTVKGDSPFANFRDIVAWARKYPGKLAYGSVGVGSFGHLIMEQVAKKENVRFTHVPYKGSPDTQVALLGGHIPVATGDFNYSSLDSGQIRLILLITDGHSPDYPKVPILKDLGYDIPAPTMLNIAGPKGMPDEVVKRLDDAYARAMKEPAFIKGMRDLRLTTFYRSGKELDSYTAANYDAFAKLLRDEGTIK